LWTEYSLWKVCLIFKKVCEFEDQIASAVQSFWKNGSCIAILKPMYMVSRMVSSLLSVPQVAHMDFDKTVVDKAKHKTLIVFALA